MAAHPSITLDFADSPAETQLALTTILSTMDRKPDDVQTIVHTPLDRLTLVLFKDFKWFQIKSDRPIVART